MGNMGLNVSLRVVWQSLIFGVIASPKGVAIP